MSPGYFPQTATLVNGKVSPALLRVVVVVLVLWWYCSRIPHTKSLTGSLQPIEAIIQRIKISIQEWHGLDSVSSNKNQAGSCEILFSILFFKPQQSGHGSQIIILHTGWDWLVLGPPRSALWISRDLTFLALTPLYPTIPHYSTIICQFIYIRYPIYIYWN